MRVLNVGPPGALTRLQISSVEELAILGPTPSAFVIVWLGLLLLLLL